jgi:hypothetical protein
MALLNSRCTRKQPGLSPLRGLGPAVLLLALCSPALALTETPSPTFTSTPTETPCQTVAPPQLSVSLDVQPAHPVVGDQVVLTFTAFAAGGIPSYTVFGYEPVLQGNPGPVRDNVFGTPVRFELTAAQAGTAMVSLSVNFETSAGCVDNPFFQFVTLSSDPFPIEIAAPTPTATPTCAADTPSLSVSLDVQPPHPVVGDLVVLTFSAHAPGGIPTYTVFDYEPVLQGHPDPVHDSMFDHPVKFELTAAQAGTAMVRLSVNFETLVGCFFTFVTLSSDPFPIEVAALVPTATPTATPSTTCACLSPTLTPTATPTSTQVPTNTPAQLPTTDEGGGCSLIPAARAYHSALLLVLPVAWFLRHGRGRSRRKRVG